mmetsp:Transcript_13628/g.29210  ORF Transcript_13628/g.29210 Transcript_13628/m.29210 type:complete len:1109 (+) Transcript_13628:206-3532(+)
MSKTQNTGSELHAEIVKQAVRNVRNNILECHKHLRKLPESQRAWDSIANQLNPAAELLTEMAQRYPRVWWPRWSDDEVSTLYVDLICSVLEKFRQFQLHKLPGPRRKEMLHVVLCCLTNVLCALQCASIFLLEEWQTSRQLWPYLFLRLDGPLVLSICEVISQAGQLVDQVGPASSNNWHAFLYAAGSVSLNIKFKLEVFNPAELNAALQHPACIIGYNLLAQNMMQSALKTPSILRTMQNIPHDDGRKDDRDVHKLWMHGAECLGRACMNYLSQPEFERGEIPAPHTACIEQTAFHMVEVTLGLAAKQQQQPVHKALPWAMAMLRMRAIVRQAEGADPGPYVEAALQVVEHLLQHNNTGSGQLNQRNCTPEDMNNEHAWYQSAKLLHEAVVESALLRPAAPGLPTSLLLRLHSTSEAALRHIVLQPSLRQHVAPLLAVHANCLRLLSPHSSSSNRDTGGAASGAADMPLQRLVQLYLSTLSTVSKAAFALRSPSIVEGHDCGMSGKPAWFQMLLDVQGPLLGNLVQVLEIAAARAAEVQEAGDGEQQTHPHGALSELEQVQAIRRAAATSGSSNSSGQGSAVASDAYAASAAACSGVMPILLYQQHEIIEEAAVGSSSAVSTEVLQLLCTHGGCLKRLADLHVACAPACKTRDAELQYLSMLAVCCTSSMASALGRQLLQDLPELPASVDSALHQAGGLQRLEALYRPPEVPGTDLVCVEWHQMMRFATWAFTTLTREPFNAKLLGRGLACAKAALAADLPSVLASMSHVAAPWVLRSAESAEPDSSSGEVPAHTSAQREFLGGLWEPLNDVLITLVRSLVQLLKQHSERWKPVAESGGGTEPAGPVAAGAGQGVEAEGLDPRDGPKGGLGRNLLTRLLLQCCTHCNSHFVATRRLEKAGLHLLQRLHSGACFTRQELQLSVAAAGGSRQLDIQDEALEHNEAAAATAAEAGTPTPSGSITLGDDLTSMLEARRSAQQAASDLTAALLSLWTELEQLLQQEEGDLLGLCSIPDKMSLPLRAELLQAELLCGVPMQLKRWGCDNPWCTNLQGPSELQLKTSACAARCGARYCSKECQRKAWKEGHKHSCARMAAFVSQMSGHHRQKEA